MRSLLRGDLPDQAAAPRPRHRDAGAQANIEHRPSEAGVILQAYSGGDAAAFREALVNAMFDHPERQRAQSRREIARARAEEAEAGLFPTVDGGVSAGGTYSASVRDDLGGRTQPEGFSEDMDLSLTARQLLFDRGAVFDRTDAAKAFARQARFEEADAAGYQAVVAAEAYFQVIAARAEQDFTDRLLERMEGLHRQVQERYESGASTVSDVLRASAQVSAIRAERVRVEQKLAEAVSIYIEAFGKEPGELLLPDLAMELPATAEDAALSATTASSRIRAAKALRDGRRAEHAAAEADLWPRVELEASAAQLDVNDNGGDFVGAVGLRFRWRLYEGGAQSARTRAAKAALREAGFTEARTRRRLEQEARAAFAAHRSVRRRLSISAVALREAELARDAARDQFLVRGGTLLDVLDAERTAYRASVDWISAELDLQASQVRLMWTSGALPAWFGDAWAFDNAPATD